MARNLNIIASSRTDKHGTRMAVSALEDIVNIINGDRKIRVAMEHDMSIPPLGYVNNAKLVNDKDGNYYVVAEYKLYDRCEIVEFQDGQTLYIEDFENEEIKFIEIKNENPLKIKLRFDAVNFESYNEYVNFKNDIKKEFKDIEVQEIMRKSEIPDPQVIFDLTSAIATYIFGKEIIPKIMDSTLSQVSQDVGSFYSMIKRVAIKTGQTLQPFDRPITYIFTSVGIPIVELLIITRDSDEVITSISKEKVDLVRQKIIDLSLLGRIAKIQFVYENSSWKFNYAITEDGKSIGSEKVYDEKNKRMKKFNLELGYQEDKKTSDK